MKQKEVILFKSKVNKNTTSSKFTFRAIVRYVIIASVIALTAFTLFDISGPIQDADAAKKASMKLIICFLTIIIGAAAVRMNQLYFNGSILNITMVLISIGYATFITIFLRDANPANAKDYVYLFYFAWPIVALILIWYIGASIFERNTRPFLSKFMIWKIVNLGLVIGLIWLAYLFVYKHTSLFGNNNWKSINLQDKAQFTHIFFIGMLVVLILSLFVTRWWLYRNKLKTEDILKNVSIAVAIMIILPLTIWYVTTYFVLPSFRNDYLMIIADAIAIIVSVIYTFFRKSRVSSPVVSAVVYSVSLLMIWMNKFAMEYVSGYSLTHDWETVLTLVSILSVIILIFIKNNPVTKSQSLSQLTFVVFVAIYVLIEWVMSGWPDARDELNSLLKIIGISYDEALNTFVLFSALTLVVSSLMNWYRVQSVINNNLSRKLRKEKGGANA